MDKNIFDTNNGLWYELIGDYYIPRLTLPTEENGLSAFGGRQYLRYIQEFRKPLYIELLTSGRLSTYLSEIDEKAEDMFFRLVKGLANKDGITAKLKAEDQILWVQRMNSARETATEAVNNDLIYV